MHWNIERSELVPGLYLPPGRCPPSQASQHTLKRDQIKSYPKISEFIELKHTPLYTRSDVDIYPVPLTSYDADNIYSHVPVLWMSLTTLTI